jgi:hypothetical protein
MDVSRPEDLPKKTTGDNALLLLERATILQAMGRHDLSARDFETADKNIEVIDFTSDTAGDIGKWVFSDDSGVYRTPPHEKLLINTLNLINYLVRGDANGAKIEARRFQINDKYFKDKSTKSAGLMAFGSYPGGLCVRGGRQRAGGASVLRRRRGGRRRARSGRSRPAPRRPHGSDRRSTHGDAGHADDAPGRRRSVG